MRKEGNGGRSSKTEAKTKYAMTISVAEKVNALSAGNNRVCSNGGSGEDKRSGSKGVRTECRGSF